MTTIGSEEHHVCRQTDPFLDANRHVNPPRQQHREIATCSNSLPSQCPEGCDFQQYASNGHPIPRATSSLASDKGPSPRVWPLPTQYPRVATDLGSPRL